MFRYPEANAGLIIFTFDTLRDRQISPLILSEF